MALEKFPRMREIAWGKIHEVRFDKSRERDSYSFEFDLDGRKQKMTISFTPDSVSYTLSTDDGNPIATAIQKGGEVKVIDFSRAPGLGGAAGRLKKIGKIRKN
ncbi:Uncharacterised protein [uncultured archaeon]|nr:Uncharacterised protein [uncultured archaeon]